MIIFLRFIQEFFAKQNWTFKDKKKENEISIIIGISTLAFREQRISKWIWWLATQIHLLIVL